MNWAGNILSLYIFIICLIGISCKSKDAILSKVKEEDKYAIRGWTILSDDTLQAKKVLDRTHLYDINHLQLSHHLIHDLKDIRNDIKRNKVNTIINYAKNCKIEEIVVWDHALYNLSYYPKRFRTGPDSTLNLDDPLFWEWFKEDYRSMLNLLPNINGVVLTFIETGARVENQYSTKLKTNQEKLAYLVNTVASVVIDEYNFSLYARTFSYTSKEYDNIIGAVHLFDNKKIKLMIKETPHDFFLTHPSDPFAGSLPFQTIIEFDTGCEFHGQGIVANTWPEHIITRCNELMRRDHIIGYTARTDRYYTSTIIDQPSEINLMALAEFCKNPNVTPDQIYHQYIGNKYGAKAMPLIKTAFQSSYHIATSIFYTLGTNTSNHSHLNFDPYPSSYARHVSGKWINPPLIYIEHTVNKKFHYWSEIINQIAPAWAKSGGAQYDEVPYVLDSMWISQGDLLNEEFLNYILSEKQYGVNLAKSALEAIEKAKPYLVDKDYHILNQYFTRTYLTSSLYLATSKAYFGFRVYCNQKQNSSIELKNTINQGLDDIVEISKLINEYPHKGAKGEWTWSNDTKIALRYVEQIKNGSWPKYANKHLTYMDNILFKMDD